MNKVMAVAASMLAAAAMARADGTQTVSQLTPAALAAAQQAKDAADLRDGTGPIRAEPVAGGVGASVNLLRVAEAPGFFMRNWGKLLSGAGAAGGYALVARNNGMWPFKKDSSSGAGIADSGNTSTRTVTTTQSDRHDVNVSVSKNSAPVTVIVDQSTGAQ